MTFPSHHQAQLWEQSRHLIQPWWLSERRGDIRISKSPSELVLPPYPRCQFTVLPRGGLPITHQMLFKAITGSVSPAPQLGYNPILKALSLFGQFLYQATLNSENEWDRSDSHR